MDLLDKQDINNILKPYGLSNPITWSIENYSDKLIGYLGDHLRLKVTVDSDGKTLNFFIKCLPRLDKWKANNLKKAGFFKKEFVMLTKVFTGFDDINQDTHKWRPKLLLAKEELYVFEDVTEQGYQMPDCEDIMTYEEIKASVETLARFHAKSLIFEEKKSSQLGRPYRLWENYSDILYEPEEGQTWRDAGMKAIIDLLKVFSKYIHKPNFSRCLEVVIPMLFKGAQTLIEPSVQYRNVIIHRDLWANNIFQKKKDDDNYQVLFVDFQTVLYSSPMLDLSSFIFFNTNKDMRKTHTDHILDIYHKVLTQELNNSNLDVNAFFDKDKLLKAYEESILFGITQAAIIVPIVAMTNEKRMQIFGNPDTSEVVNTVSRSKEFIQVAVEDDRYRNRVIELFEEIVERYIYTNMHN